MLERDVERTLRRQVERAGGLCLKFISSSWSGAPDRVVLFPGGKIAFIELKRPGEEPRPLQWARIRKLREMGFLAEVVDDIDRIPALLEKIRGNAPDGSGEDVKT